MKVGEVCSSGKEPNKITCKIHIIKDDYVHYTMSKGIDIIPHVRSKINDFENWINYSKAKLI